MPCSFSYTDCGKVEKSKIHKILQSQVVRFRVWLLRFRNEQLANRRGRCWACLVLRMQLVYSKCGRLLVVLSVSFFVDSVSLENSKDAAELDATTFTDFIAKKHGDKGRLIRIAGSITIVFTIVWITTGYDKIVSARLMTFVVAGFVAVVGSFIFPKKSL